MLLDGKEPKLRRKDGTRLEDKKIRFSSYMAPGGPFVSVLIFKLGLIVPARII